MGCQRAELQKERGIDGGFLPSTDVTRCALMREWLQRWRRGRWGLIYDDVVGVFLGEALGRVES